MHRLKHKGKEVFQMASKCQDVYEEPIIMKMPGCIARVYRPVLTPEERAKRMKEIEKAAEKVLKEAMRGEMNAKKAIKGNG